MNRFGQLSTAHQRFGGLSNQALTATRTVYFSENPDTNQFFITVRGQTPQTFDNNNPPSIITTQGWVEQWTIQNQALENHEFHMHQIHFLVWAPPWLYFFFYRSASDGHNTVPITRGEPDSRARPHD
jgi:FtsP/CotA-like multicopper oxidase with cupredoxin domain